MDVSNYSGALTPEHVAAFKAEGVKFLVAGTQQPVVCKQQLAAAKAGGLEIAAYIYLEFDNRFRPRLNTAIDICKNYSPPLMLWLDVEDEKSGKTWLEIIGLLREAGRMCDDTAVPWGIYTSFSKWQALTGNCDVFKNTPLWDAAYDGEPTFDYLKDDPHRPYGGWIEATVQMKQYLGDVKLAGVRVDMNVRQMRLK